MQNADATVQIEAILDELAELCCQALTSGSTLDAERRDELVQSLSANGWERHEPSQPLSTEIKKRVKDRCREPGMHRGAAIDGLTEQIEKAYQDYSRYRTSAPQQENDDDPMPPRTTG